MAVVTIDGRRAAARVYDISANGARIGRIPDAQTGALCKMELPGYGTVIATIVRVAGDRFAVTFPPDPALREYMDDPEAVFERLRAVSA